MKSFDEKTHFPLTYGDKNSDKVMLSDYVVSAAKSKRVQKHLVAVVVALFTLGTYSRSASAIPADYGEAANEMLNQAAQNGAAAGNVPAVPPIGQIKGQVPLALENQRCTISAMPIEQQHLIAAQQAGQMGPMPGPGIGGPNGPTNPPAFYIPGKPKAVGPRAANSIAFTTALGIICLNASWGEPVAILMCSSGLIGLAYKFGKDVAVFMAKNLT